MKKLRKREWLIIFGIFIVVAAVLLPSIKKEIKGTPEIDQIKASTSKSEQNEILLTLLKRVGPIETQEAMRLSGLPFTGETHLLIHTIGDYIFDNYGLEGLKYCKDYYLSACHHGFIINTLGDYGMEGVATALENCKKEPVGVFPQCAHAAGHGFVAWHDYDLLKGLEMCDALGEKVANFPSYNCYDGAFMENVWGVHNGAPSEKRWVKSEDIYYPCNDPRIPEKYLGGCWSNQATLIYQYFKGDLKKTAQACDGVSNPEHRKTCYNNFARQIHPITRGDTTMAHELCQNASSEEWRNYCLLTLVSAAFSVGGRIMPFAICDSLKGEVKEECTTQLISHLEYYYPQISARAMFCEKIKESHYQSQCQN